MRSVEPEIYLVAETSLDANSLGEYLGVVGADGWEHDQSSDGEGLVEVAGRLCYRSWKPGLNPNVTKVREDGKEYVANVLAQKHGSVLEHAQVSFIFHNVSRVFSHELVRHRVGVAISQESMRYVRLDDIPFWQPAWACADEELQGRNKHILAVLEEHQRWLAEHFKLDDAGVPFHEKKAKTSYMRRFAPDGVATSILWSANLRALRHVLALRTSLAAEEEIRLVFQKVGVLALERWPHVFQDFVVEDGWYKPTNERV